jgi:hypothetical protein
MKYLGKKKYFLLLQYICVYFVHVSLLGIFLSAFIKFLVILVKFNFT